MFMNTMVNKVSMLAIGLAATITIGVALSGKNSVQTEATGATIYDYYSNTDSGLSANVSQTVNWVLTDANATANKFTFNVGSNAYASPTNTVWLGGTSSASLTGSSAGQFAFGSPSLKSLATTTNLTSNGKLYGFRMNSDIDLTYYKDVTVTIGWLAGGDTRAYTGFIAKSLGGSTEAWSLLTGAKQTVAASVDGNLSFTDTTNTVLMGQSKARFAIIIGGTGTKKVLKNVYIKITANLRTSLDSVDTPVFNHGGHYYAGENFDFSKFSFTAHYLYRISGPTVTVFGNSSGVTLSFNSNFSSPLVNNAALPTTGTYTLYYKYFDSAYDPSGLNPKTNSVAFVIIAAPLAETGIYMADAVNYTASPLYKYDIYQPQLTVYPLFNSATTPAAGETPLSPSQYTTSLAAGTMLTSSTSNIATSGSFTSTLSVTVGTRNSTGISLSGQKTSFYLGDAFSTGSLVVTGSWGAGQPTTPSFASSQTDGKYTVSKTIGEILNTEGNQTITVSYYVNGSNVTSTYQISVTLQTATFFTHTFDGPISPATTGEWGVTASPVYGVITDRTTTLSDSVSGSSGMDWILNTTSTNPTNNNTAFGMDDDAGACIRFGTEALDGTDLGGPSAITMETANVATDNVNGSIYNSISRITVNMETGAAGTLTATVAGVSPTSYAINYGTPVTASSATTLTTGEYNYYTFYFPYTLIGKVKISYTNAATPGHVDLDDIALIGYALPVADQATVFANMLDQLSSCYASAYNDNLASYNYLSGTGATAYLSSITLSHHNSITASSLWSILLTRYSGSHSTSATPDIIRKDNAQLTIILISIFGFTAMGAYFFYNKKKADKEN